MACHNDIFGSIDLRVIRTINNKPIIIASADLRIYRDRIMQGIGLFKRNRWVLGFRSNRGINRTNLGFVRKKLLRRLSKIIVFCPSTVTKKLETVNPGNFSAFVDNIFMIVPHIVFIQNVGTRADSVQPMVVNPFGNPLLPAFGAIAL